MKPKIVFAGTPEFSVPCLSALLAEDVDLVGVYTQPDRVAGRGKKLQASPVKQSAVDAGIDVFQPDSFKQKSARDALARLAPDLMIVVAYGLILPQSVLNIPRLGCVNVHASLLPRWRGAAPIQRAIEAGDIESGVCLMQMDKGLDTGPVLACSSTRLKNDETGGSLHDRLSVLGAQLLIEKLSNILNKQIQAKPQTENGVNYAHKLNKNESLINWTDTAVNIDSKIRAFNPWPGTHSRINDQPIRIHQCTILDKNSSTQPGEIVGVSASGIEVQTGEGCLLLTMLQKSGGKALHARDFLNGFRLKTSQQFD